MDKHSRSVYRALIAIIVLAPLPFASNRPWAWSFLAIAVGLLTIIWAWAAFQRNAQRTFPISRLILPTILYLGVCFYAVVQTLPLGIPGVPSQFWISARQAGIEGVRPTISISPIATWTALMRLATYGATFWLILQTCRSSRRTNFLAAAIGYSAAAYAVYGILVSMSGSQSILWFDKWAYEESVTGTFINRNSFATFLGLGLLCIVAHFINGILDTVRTGGGGPFGQRLLSNGISLDLMTNVVATMCLVAALLLTQSRAGVFSSLIAVLVFLLGLTLRSHRSRAVGIFTLASILLLFALLFDVSGTGLKDRLSRLIWTDADLSSRATVYASTLTAIGDRPLLGFGYGTFEDGFKIYRSEDTKLYFDKAHNTYLELAMELGIPAATALVLTVATLAFLCFRGWRIRQRQFIYPWLGCCAALLVGLHSLVDFSLQIPSVAIQFTTILAIGCVQSWRPQRIEQPPNQNT